MIRYAYSGAQLLLALALTSCAAQSPPVSTATTGSGEPVAESAPQPPPAEPPRAAIAEDAEEDRGDTIRKGTGEFVQPAGSGSLDGYADADGVTLNFEESSLPEFLRVVFESILEENYLLDPGIRGTVTLHTTRPVTRDAVLPIVEAVLEQNGAAIIRDKGVFRVVPLAGAAGESGSPAVGRYPSSRRDGYGIQVVPLQHVSAAELESVIIPFVPDGLSLIHI